MAQIRVNDIFDELIEENTKITECLNVLIRFKTFVDLVFDKLKTKLDSNVLEMFEDLHKEVEHVFTQNKRDFSVHKNTNYRITELIEFLSSKPQTNQYLSSNQSIDSIKLKSRLLLKKSTSSCDQSLSQMKTIDNKDIDENKSYICGFVGCGQRLKNWKSLKSHQRIHSTNPKPFQCDFEGCSFSTRSRGHLTDHINAHKGIKPFSCETCGKPFGAERYLRQHIELIHKLTDEILICEFDDCHKEFRSEKSLINHQKHNHIKEKRFACEQPNCPFRTVNPSLLKQHISKVHSKHRPYHCPFEGCPKAYKDTKELNRHIRGHTAERNYKCEFEGCDKAFKTALGLKKHNILHSDIEIRCDWPGCEYITKNNIRLRAHQCIHSCERNFPCNWPQCGKRFKNKIKLEIHHRIHRNDRRYACSWPGCQYRCTDSGNLIKHRRVHIKS